MSEENSLIRVPQGDIVSTEVVNQIALRLQRTYQPPKKRAKQTEEQYQEQVVHPEDFPIVVELAMAQGHNPLSKTFHYWKQDGAVRVDDHYAPLMNWAQQKSPFTYTTQVLSVEEKSKLEGINPNDYVVRFKAIRRADQTAYQAYFKSILDFAKSSGVDFDVALETAEHKADFKFSTQAEGVVKYEEIHYQYNGEWVLNVFATPKGWTPGITRAEVRAIRNGIKKLVGMPMPEERRRLGLDIDMREVAQLAAEVPMEIVEQGVTERYMELEAQVKEVLANYKEETDGMTPKQKRERREERVKLLRGVDEGEIGTWTAEEEALVLTEEAEYSEEETVSSDMIDEALTEHAQADAEYESRQISLEEARAILLKSYRTEEALGKALFALLAANSLSDLTEIDRWNMAQYALRKDVLNNVNIPIEQRFALIPEISEGNPNPPKTVKEAGPFLHETLKTLCFNQKKMRRLNSGNN